METISPVAYSVGRGKLEGVIGSGEREIDFRTINGNVKIVGIEAW